MAPKNLFSRREIKKTIFRSAKNKKEKAVEKMIIPPQKHGDFTELITESIKQTHKMHLMEDIEALAKTKSITELVDLIIRKAWESGTSDIHIDPQPNSVIVRYRIDGILHDVLSLKKELQPLIITRVKVLAGLRTDEHFMAQDGRFRVVYNKTTVDLRISIVPTHHQENIVMRLLVGEARALGLGELGFTDHDLKTLHRYIKKPYGMILSTGPTGSGKTTTLYSIIRLLNSREVNIITIEDPIEYAVQGITQIQVNPQTDLTFAKGLRSIVRQDPNVIMVGEIRDEETADIAVNAAMTGHLLLSTLHTNDAPTTLPRLLDMSIEPFLIASTVNMIIGQRLVRKLCTHCKIKYVLTSDERNALIPAIPETLLKNQKEYWRGNGCEKCNGSGYVGRLGIFEVLEITDAIRKLIMRRSNADELRTVAREEGMTTMLEDGFKKAANGTTSLAEILRVIHE